MRKKRRRKPAKADSDRQRRTNTPATVRVKPSSYQPTKAELEEEVRIPTSPERLAKALGRQINIEYEDD